MKTPITLRQFHGDEPTSWPRATLAVLVVFVVFPILVGCVTALAWFGAP